MESIPVTDSRTVAIMGHTGSGKTSLLDALLFKLGINDRLGRVDNGTSAADYTDEEKGRKITLFSKPFSGVHTMANGRKTALTFIDTPGYLDFFGQVVASMQAAECVLIAVDAVAGVQVGTRQTWKLAEKSRRAKGIVVTGLDRENANFSGVVEAIRESFGPGCVPVVVPMEDNSGVVDILASRDVPDAMAENIAEARGSLIELAAETDDTLIEKYLAGESLSPEEIGDGLRAAVASGSLVPVFAVMSLKELGLDALLDNLARLFPSPADYTWQDKDEAPIASGEAEPMTALVWRSLNDPYVGHLSIVRVLGGTLKADSEVQNTTKDHKERVGSLLRINGKKQEAVSEATAGDIVAIPKLKATAVGDTLCSGHSLVMPGIHFPKPVMFQAIQAKTQADEDKLGTALARVCDDDPTLVVERNTETHEMVLEGLGDVHIDVAVSMMKSRSNVSVNLSTPKVPYRETVTALGEGHHKHKKQSGGRGQYGEVYLRVEPKQPDEEEWFVNAIVGGVIPGNFIPAVQKGLVEGMNRGAVAGYPVSNVKVTLYDGTYHDVDSSEIAFKIAGARALRDAMSKAKPVLLEPIMTVNVAIPDQFLGDINGDLNHKRGRILGMGIEDGMQVITAEVPQAELFRYAAELRSMTGGQGTFEMAFARYDIVPQNVAQKVIAETEKIEEED